ncbi:PREDICTED: thioredoxin-related transmembrane protein 1 isoform X1 [Cercocebus atys]|uniref:thioredoxin-related transmembrane protein 1 isoform X1 n=1 Tax=Cercocebus atys TaxID=9531 RepID=UPI0005F528A4|nr:PREDICTED: thioredoxin-related transmembrane protein 1 isoform X1 [Cercocebus atys]
MAPSGSPAVLLAVLVLLLWGAPWTHGRRSNVRVITDENWRELLEGDWMIEFYAPWCPACQNLQPEWESFAEWGEDLEVNVAKVDVTEQPGLSGRFIITALPTIYHCKDGEFRRYQGPRTKKDFINFISDKEWKSIEPVSSWFGPGSVLMSSMSALFQLSMWIRACHNYFIEDLGLPVWGSYTVFALATLFSGLLLGLCMIFVADCLCPSKRRRPQPYPYPSSVSSLSWEWKMLCISLKSSGPRVGDSAERIPQNFYARKWQVLRGLCWNAWTAYKYQDGASLLPVFPDALPTLQRLLAQKPCAPGRK